MRYTLSENIIKFIKEENISQKELEKTICKLHEEGKVGRILSQQSISRYLRGKQFPGEDTESIIFQAVEVILGQKKFRLHKKKYQLEQKQKDKELQEKKAKKKAERNSFISIELRELITNEKYRDMLMSDEDIYYYEEQKDQAETRQVIEFWRNAPEEIQGFWLETLDIFSSFSKYIKEIILCMIGVKQNILLEIANYYYFQYCSSNIYSIYINGFSDEELQIMGRLMIVAGKAHEKIYEFVQEGSDIYNILTIGECEWKICDNDEKYIIVDKKEHFFVTLYERSKMSYEEFIYYASLLTCMEKEDWLVIHMAFLLEKLQKNEQCALFEDIMWITDVQKDLIYLLRSYQPQ